MYSFNEQLLKTKEEIEDLNLLSIIKGFGGNIVEDSYELCLKDDLIYFSKIKILQLSLTLLLDIITFHIHT